MSAAVVDLDEDDDMLESITLAQVPPYMVKYMSGNTLGSTTAGQFSTQSVTSAGDTEIPESTVVTGTCPEIEFPGDTTGYAGESPEVLGMTI